MVKRNQCSVPNSELMFSFELGAFFIFDLEDKVLLRLQPQLADCLTDVLLQLQVSLTRNIQQRKQITDQTQEYRHVTRDNLRQVEIP